MNKEKKKNKNLFENVKTLFYAVIAALIIRSFFFEPFSIPSGSMYPTLVVGDYLFVSKSSYGFTCIRKDQTAPPTTTSRGGMFQA